MKTLSTPQKGQALSALDTTVFTVDISIETPSEHPNEKKRPSVCLGMPLYNQTEKLPAALKSVLAQTYKNFQLVVVDDSNCSEPGEIIKKFAAIDERIRYVKNPYRMGLVDNWKRCFELSDDADYFCWVSDHDVWHPEFLRSLIEILNSYPSVVLSYPKTGYILPDDSKRIKKNVPPPFSTLGMSESNRINAVCQNTKYFGKMVYGLYRASALRSAGVFRRVLFPDVVLLFELCLRGDFVQVDEELRFYRFTEKFSIARQKRSLFIKKPWYIFLPWPFVNAFFLLWYTAICSPSEGFRYRLQGCKISFIYLRRYLSTLGKGSWIGSYREWRYGKKPLLKKIKKRLK